MAELAHRFDINNRELNKRRFNDQYAHIISASKASKNKQSKKTKFIHKEVTLSLTPPNEVSPVKEHGTEE